jgi:hypothetical protein
VDKVEKSLGFAQDLAEAEKYFACQQLAKASCNLFSI